MSDSNRSGQMKRPRQPHERHKDCNVCARLPYRISDAVLPILADQDVAFDFAAGVYEFIDHTSPNRDDSYKLDEHVARKTTDRCRRHVRRLQNELAKTGVIQKVDQRYTGVDERARYIAPFDLSEVELGPMLGTGGFSSVFEVSSLKPDPQISKLVNKHERASRDFLSRHAQRLVAETDGSAVKNRHRGPHDTVPRYALKRLRRSLLKEPEKFERAAIDLVLEVQLLLSLDHPNIISLRGWSYDGVQGLLDGTHKNFFMIIDRLPITLEDRILAWRAAVKRAKTRYRLPWSKQKYANKLDVIFADRLLVCRDIAAALEYMHDRRIINRDIKITNMGFDVLGELKVFDLGLARLLPRRREGEGEGDDDSYLMSRVGTKYYMAPEVKRKEPYNTSADVYSYGVCLWELMALGSPRDALRKVKEDKNNTETHCPLPLCKCWPETLRDLLLSCISYNPKERPKIADVRFNLDVEMDALGLKRKSRPVQRRSTFRVNLAGVAAIKKGLESSESGTSPSSDQRSLDQRGSETREATSSEMDDSAESTLSFQDKSMFDNSMVEDSVDESAAFSVYDRSCDLSNFDRMRSASVVDVDSPFGESTYERNNSSRS